MRLSDWRAASPSREAAGQKVSALVDPILVALGAPPDPVAWVLWGEEPTVRYTIFVPSPAGLISCYVRVNVVGEGPRAAAKLTRWSRVQIGELAIETQSGHRLLTFQVEQQVLRGADEEADRIGEFAVALFAAIDGRPTPEPAAGRSARSAARTEARTTTSKAAGKAAGAKRPVGAPARKAAGTPTASTTRRRG
jgi:hypothetical protein